MNWKHALSGTAVAVVIVSGQSQAELIPGQPIYVPSDNTEVTVEFIYSDASYTGDLYFLGSGEEESVVDWAQSDDETGLGQFLFNNHASPLGSTMVLEGVFDEGDVLHFAYNVTDPPGAAVTFRTDAPEDVFQFGYDAETGDLGIEDIPLPLSDQDYNDIQVKISYHAVPSAGSLTLLGLAGALSYHRRR